MIKATLTDINGTRILLLGLSHGNLDRLRADGTKGVIRIDGNEVGWPGYMVMITAGETEASMAHDFAEFIGPHTKVHVSSRLKS